MSADPEDNDWLYNEPDEDWLSTESPTKFVAPWSREAISLPAVAEDRNAAVQKAWDLLTPRQRVFLGSLRMNHFNVAETCRKLALTSDAAPRSTVRNWIARDADFQFVLKAMKAIARDEVIDPDRLLLRADEIAEKALERVPILYQGSPTGFYEHDLKTALSANEQLMKTQKMLSSEEQKGGFREGPPLLIQVVIGDQVQDVARAGVVIDMPVPDGP